MNEERVMYGRLVLVAAVLGGVLCASPMVAQDVNANSVYGDIHLAAGFTPDPVSRTITAGGAIPVSVSAACDYGWVGDAPDVKLFYEAGSDFSLYIYAESDDDVILLINLPDGSWVCDDDSHTGLDPLARFSIPLSGRYDIWVGTFGEELVPARLFISEIRP
jgi:hypothetical protein